MYSSSIAFVLRDPGSVPNRLGFPFYGAAASGQTDSRTYIMQALRSLIHQVIITETSS